MANYKGALMKDTTEVFGGVTVEETYEAGSQIPTLVGSFYSEGWPRAGSALVQPGDPFQFALSDGRKAEVFIQNVASVSEDLYLTVFYFSSQLE